MSMQGTEAQALGAISTAIDAAVLRQQVIAHNIANAHTPGFRPGRVSFEAALDAAAAGSTATRANAPQESLPASVSLGAADSVRLDEELAAMSQNAAHYQALLRALNRHLSVLSIAVADGKR